MSKKDYVTWDEAGLQSTFVGHLIGGPLYDSEEDRYPELHFHEESIYVNTVQERSAEPRIHLTGTGFVRLATKFGFFESRGVRLSRIPEWLDEVEAEFARRVKGS